MLEEFGNRHLGDGWTGQGLSRLKLQNSVTEFAGRNPADPQTGRQRFRDGTAKQNQSFLIERFRSNRTAFARGTKIAINVVLDQGDSVFRQNRNESLFSVRRQRASERVAVVGYQEACTDV